MSSKPVTIRDVAQQAGVSESTVSRVLSGSETAIAISEETRERVLQAARELSYRPHPGARALKGKGTNLLGLIVREIDDPFFAQLIETTSNLAKEHGYDLVLGYAKADPEEALALSQMFDLRHCDGILLLGDLREAASAEALLDQMGREQALVLVCRGSTELVANRPSVGVDNRRGAHLALEHLAGLGHRRIAFVDAGRQGDLRERLEAYVEFMEARFGGVPEGGIVTADNSYAGGYQATTTLLSLPEPPTAIFAADDTMAIGALKAAADLSFEVPRDLSVAGFDDIKIAAYLRPALTTVRQPVEEIGRQTVELLLTLIKEELEPHSCPQYVLAPELIVRDSCGPPP